MCPGLGEPVASSDFSLLDGSWGVSLIRVSNRREDGESPQRRKEQIDGRGLVGDLRHGIRVP